MLEEDSNRRSVAIVLLVFLIAAGFGSLHEIYQWFSDSNFGTRYQPNPGGGI